jgi:hypothetical protein
MSTMQEIEAAIPTLSPAELETLRKWFEDYLQDRLPRNEAPQASAPGQPLRIRSFSQRRVLTPVISTGELADELFLRQ